MRAQPYRLAADAPHFSGTGIDRATPIAFRLNGEEIAGYSGDTVLSAALACGIVTAGTWRGAPLALDERFSPPTVDRRKPDVVVPMHRTAAVAGADYITLGARRPTPAAADPLDRARRFFFGPHRTLGHRYDGLSGIYGPWLDAEPAETRTCDLAVVGGGVAGLSAALAAAEAGERVLVLEAEAVLGGNAAYFGTAEGEEPVDEAIARLVAAVVASAQIATLCNAEVQGIEGLVLRIHRVHEGAGRIVAVTARRIVLATGATERLPVFPGNRSPGVGGTLAAWRRATRHGVWIGRNVRIATSANHGYRLAVGIADCGVRVQRVHDVRPRPASRFIDFAKATGIPMAIGMVPREARPAGQGLVGLHVTFASLYDDREHLVEPVWTEQLLVCGGWQPRIGLWHMAGGASIWEAGAARLAPRGRLPDIALAGSAAGWRGTKACLASGATAVSLLLEREPEEAIEDPAVDPVFESVDGPAPVDREGGRWPAFLDWGTTFAALPAPPRARARGRARLGLQRMGLEGHARALSTADVAATVQLGVTPPHEASAVAQERFVLPAAIAGRDDTPPPPLSDAWLAGRYGDRAARWLVTTNEARAFEPGSLVFANSDGSRPHEAVGVVLAPAGSGRAVVLLGTGGAAPGDMVVVRDSGAAVRVRLLEDVKTP